MFQYNTVRSILRLALVYAVAIPFIGFLISRNPTIGWIVFALSFVVFSFMTVDRLSIYTAAPHEPAPAPLTSDEGVNPVAALTELTRLASKPNNVYTSELLLERIRQAFLTKVRLILDLSPAEMRQMLSNKARLSQVVRDSELVELLEGRLGEFTIAGQKRIEPLLSKVETWTL